MRCVTNSSPNICLLVMLRQSRYCRTRVRSFADGARAGRPRKVGAGPVSEQSRFDARPYGVDVDVGTGTGCCGRGREGMTYSERVLAGAKCFEGQERSKSFGGTIGGAAAGVGARLHLAFASSGRGAEVERLGSLGEGIEGAGVGLCLALISVTSRRRAMVG